MSRDGTLPPGVEHCDIPGESDEEHHPDCPAQEVSSSFSDTLTREQLTRYLEPKGFRCSWKDETDDLRESAIGCRKYEVCNCEQLDKDAEIDERIDWEAELSTFGDIANERELEEGE